MGLFSIVARLTGDTSDFDRKMKRSMSTAERTTHAAAGRIKGWLAGAFSVAAIVALERRVLQFGAKVKDMSQQLGISTTDVQELGFAAEQSGASLEMVAAALRKLGKVRADILMGKTAEGADKIFASLGIDRAELQAKTTVQLFRELGGIIGANQGNKNIGAVSQILFGESGEKLIPVFNAGLEEMADRLHDIGGVMSEERVGQLKAAADAMTDLNQQLMVFGAEIAPMMVSVLDKMVASLQSLRNLSGAFGDSVFQSVQDGNPFDFWKLFKLNTAKRVLGNAGKRAMNDALGLVGSTQRELAPDFNFGFNPAEKAAATSGSGRRFTLGAGSLANVGGFTGNGGSRNVVLDISRQQLNELKEVNRTLDQIESGGSLDL